MDLPHTEARKREAGGPRSVAAVLDRKGWKRVSLGDVCIIKARIGWQGLKKSEYMKQGDYCLVSGTDFRNGFINWETCAFVTEWRYNQDKNIQLKDGDVLITKDGTIGKVAYVQAMKSPTSLNSGVFVIRPREDWLTPDFLQLIFKSRYFTDFLDRITAGSTIVHLYQKDIGGFSFPVPNLEEQHRIAKCIAAIDRQIATLQSLIAKYEAIKKATVNLLLQPEMGWRQVKIKDFCPLQRGFDLPKHSRHRGVFPLVCSNGVSDRIDKYLVKAPGVVTGRSGTIGNVHFLGENFWPHNTTLWVSSFIDADPLFVFYLLSELGLSRFSGGSGVPTLNRNDVHDTLVEVPSIAGQHEIAEQIATIDKTISDCKAQLEKARQLKSGMMSYFFG